MPRLSCETCPYLHVPLSDTDRWKRIREAQAAATPQYSQSTNDHATDVEMQMRAGMEARMDECPGYSAGRLILGFMADAIGGSGKLVSTEAGTRFVAAPERHCQNPFLLTEEYARLADELTPQSAARFEAGLNPTT